MNIKHGYAKRKKKSSEYNTWCSMKQRIYGVNRSTYANYGGRGIKMCAAWTNSFEQFLADMGPKPLPHKSYSIDRIDVNGNYEPSNCRWATWREQNNNQRKKATSDEIFFQGLLIGLLYQSGGMNAVYTS